MRCESEVWGSVLTGLAKRERASINTGVGSYYVYPIADWWVYPIADW